MLLLIPMVTMAQSAVNWRNTHTLMDRTHSLTHFTSTQLQPRGTKRQISYYFSVHAGSFRVSASYRSLTWTTGSLMCVRDHSCACEYTRGLGTPTASQFTVFHWEKLTHFSFAPVGIRTFVLWISSPTLYQLNHTVTLIPNCAIGSSTLDMPIGNSRNVDIIKYSPIYIV